MSAEPRFLTLVRHAQAAPASAAADDRDRPLTERGRQDARALRARLESESGGVPPIDRVACSAAVRTRETLALLEPALGAAAREAVPEASLYLASADALGARAEAAFADGSRHALLVGHNPGLEALCARLAGAPGFAMRPCERVVLRFDGAGTGPGDATLVSRDAPGGV